MGLVDNPQQKRKVHTVSIPRSGGIAIVIGVLTAAIIWMPQDTSYLPLLGCIGVLCIFGLIDDVYEVSYRFKLLGQVIAVVGFLFAYGGTSQLPFFPLDSAPVWLCLVFSFLFLLGVTNAVNLSDGLDGLAAGNSLLSLVLLAVLAAQIDELGYLVLALSLAGGLLGFLRFNTHPASVFMGDTGSQFLGFTAAALAVLILQSEQLPASPLLPILIFGLPILDTLAVITVRTIMGRPLFKADRSHLHHQLLRLGFKHYEVVAILYGLQALIAGLAYLLRFESDILILSVYVLFSATTLGVIFLARLVGWETRSKTRAGQQVDRRNQWLRKIDWYHKHAAMFIAAAVSLLFISGAVYRQTPSSEMALTALILAAALGLSWLCFQKYSTLNARVISFTASTFAVYGLTSAEARPLFNVLMDGYIGALTLALWLAILVTRKTLFRLDTQDYLVLLIVALVSFMPVAEIDSLHVARSAIRLAVLLYACEFVISKGQSEKWLTNSVGIFSLVIIGLY